MEIQTMVVQRLSRVPTVHKVIIGGDQSWLNVQDLSRGYAPWERFLQNFTTEWRALPTTIIQGWNRISSRQQTNQKKKETKKVSILGRSHGSFAPEGPEAYPESRNDTDTT